MTQIQWRALIAEREAAREVARSETNAARAARAKIEHAEDARLVTIVADRYRITVSDILGRERTAHVANARHVAAWLLRENERTYPHIAEVLRRDHSTVMYAVRRVEQKPELLAIASDICEQLEDVA
jgi:chromosomal replication initiation ATPase DnaA